ncbi:MAG: hypothetical protein JWN09_678, partial [Microbacteriaceae bacterium]|nr:hypothetical protein [Microbacteriaceae bacterium]
MTLAEIAAAIDGVAMLHTATPETTVAGSVQTDSRLVEPGSI